MRPPRVFLVAQVGWESSETVSVWSNGELAEAEAERLRAAPHYDEQFEVYEFAVDESDGMCV